jgi:hypothetical protein
MLVFGCRASPDPVAQAPVGAVPAASPKRIVRDGEGFVLPDGTRVAADEKGGFRLPNGDYVAALPMVSCYRTVGDACPTTQADLCARDKLELWKTFVVGRGRSSAT